MPQPNLEQFKAWAKEELPLALAVCKAQAAAQLQREYVDAYIRPIFDSFHFENSPTMDNKPITNPKHLYLCTDKEKVAKYYAACRAAHQEHGYTGPEGQCPALRMERLCTEAENLLIDDGKKLFGIKDVPLSLEHRQKMLDLIIGACLRAEKEEKGE